jgi:NTE family protein
MALPAIFSPVSRDGRLLMDGGLVNPLPFDVLKGDADIIVAVDVSGAGTLDANIATPSTFSTLVASTQILQRSIVREKLKAQQPDVYIDVEVDEFHVLEFHRYREVMAAAGRAKEHLSRQLQRVLASHTLEPLPPPAPEPATRFKRIALRRLVRRPGDR